MRVIYVAGSFRASTPYGIKLNVDKAEAKSLELWKQGWAVICPHLNTQHFQGECPDEVWIEGTSELLKRSDAIYLLKGWRESEGSKAEYELALELGLEIMWE